MNNYKILCLNLERRIDRKKLMMEQFETHNISYEFIKAVDGTNLNLSDPQLNLFKHSITSLHRKGVIGCALSHLNIWKSLLNDDNYQAYVVLEDDVKLRTDFTNALCSIFNGMTDKHNFIFLGIHMEVEIINKMRDVYINSSIFSIHPLNKSIFCGGTIGYIITKRGAKYLLDYIDQNGIRMVIDYLIYNSGMELYESTPHLVFSESVQLSHYHVDSDIQYDLNKVYFPLVPNNYVFDDYVFFPNKDSYGGDIKEVCANIIQLKNIADHMPNCVAFNTYGWMKHSLIEPNDFIHLENKYYFPDGLFIKKCYVNNNKLQLIKDKIKNINIDLKIFINKNALLYAKNIIKMIFKNFKKYIIVPPNEVYDISINHLMDDYHYYRNSSFNILISGEPHKSKYCYDLCIDTKYESNAKMTIYYPLVFGSIHEHKKSTNSLDYLKEKTKFCAYMYNMSYDHRIKYFHLVSKYKKVDALGKCCNNVNIEFTRNKYTSTQTYNDIAVEYYSDYKFVLAIENSNIRGYATEKLMNPLIANSIPIYWGNSEIFQIINKKRVIYIPDFDNDDSLLAFIELIDNNDTLYQSIINNSWFVDPETSIESIEKEVESKIYQMFNY